MKGWFIATVILFMTLLFCLSSYGQTIKVKDTLDAYLWSQSSDGEFFHTIDGRWVSKEKFEAIEALDSIYENINQLHFVRFRNLNGKIKYSYLDLGPDMGGPYGEYKKYYNSGRLKVHGFYTLPFDSHGGSAELDSIWTYYAKNGHVDSIKKYINGLAVDK